MSLTKVTYSMIDGTPANVLDYGADPSGVADSTTAFQAAIDSGLSVYIPNGEYKIGQLTITNGLNIVGESVSGTVLLPDVSSPFIEWDYDTNGNVILRKFLIANMTIRMDNVASTQAIKMIGAQYCVFSDLLFWDRTGTPTSLAIHLEFSYFCVLENIHCRELYSGIRLYGADFNRGPNHNVIRKFNGENFRHYGIRLDYARGNSIDTVDLEYSGDNLYYGVILNNSSYNKIQQFWYEANSATTADAAILIQAATASNNKKNLIVWTPQIIHPSIGMVVEDSLDTLIEDVRFVGGTTNISESGNTGLLIVNPQSETPSIGICDFGSTSTQLIDTLSDVYIKRTAAANLTIDSENDVSQNVIAIKQAGTLKAALISKPGSEEVDIQVAAGAGLRFADGTGFVIPVQGAVQFFYSIAAAVAEQNCLFVDSADGVLKFKDGSSVVHSLY